MIYAILKLWLVASPVLLKIKEGFYIACILLETKFSLIRQNFDFFYWKSDWNNK
jgi:hypothetical protein